MKRQKILLFLKAKKKDLVYYAAYATHPGAVVEKYRPLTFQGAVLTATKGEDVYAETEYGAQTLCEAVSGKFGYTGWEEGCPTRDSNPGNAMHYHPNTGDLKLRPHIFYGKDVNLKFKLLPQF